jgi:hypothetical protein
MNCRPTEVGPPEECAFAAGLVAINPILSLRDMSKR